MRDGDNGETAAIGTRTYALGAYATLTGRGPKILRDPCTHALLYACRGRSSPGPVYVAKFALVTTL